jgi:hypothetical protein
MNKKGGKGKRRKKQGKNHIIIVFMPQEVHFVACV